MANVLKTVWSNPWYLMIIFLSALVIISSFFFNSMRILGLSLVSVITAVFTDAIIRRIKVRAWSYPVGAVISGLIVAIALSFTTSVYIVVLTAFTAMLLKNLIRVKGNHIFNPANLGLLVVGLILNPGLAWWAVINPWIMMIFLIPIYKVKRFPVLLSFIVLFSLLQLLESKSDFDLLYTAFLGILFWVMVMIVEPLTSPQKTKSQAIFGCLTAIFAFLFMQILPVYFMLAALAAADLFVPLLKKYLG
ncbi:TPA: RnfABCDGE type electron transport complex subunit D [Candidatus Woesearchaeota archaeon]|nr:RnfABCDGE type electron transport complex subunit D [Candidatus Woesearchaeota archaeon]